MRLENSRLVTMLTEMEKSSVLARDLEGRTLGSVRGTVVDVKDPEKMGRVKVIVDGFKEDEEESHSYWVDVQVPFRGTQSEKLIGARVNITPTYSDLNRAVVSSVIFDEKSKDKDEIPGISTMNRSPVYNPRSKHPEPCKENHGCIVVQDRFPINGDRVSVCVRNWDNTYSWHVIADLKKPEGGLFGGSFLGFMSGLFENGLISSLALSFVTGGISGLLPGLTGLIPGISGLLPGSLGSIIPGFGSILGGIIPDIGGFISSGINGLTGDLLGQLTELTGISDLSSIIDLATGSLGLPSLSSLGDLVTGLPGISDIIDVTDMVKGLEGEILSGISSLTGELGVDLGSVLQLFSDEGDLPSFLEGTLRDLTGDLLPNSVPSWFREGANAALEWGSNNW